MSAASAAVAPALRLRGRSFLRSHPEWWIAALAAAAWAALIAAGAPAGGAHVHGAHPAPAAASTVPIASTAVMVVAMMGPLSLPGARYVSLTTYRSRRHRSQAAFFAGYALTWLLASIALHLAVTAVTNAAGAATAIAVAVGLAAAWQQSRARRRVLKRCRRTAAIAAEGWRGTRDCIGFGVVGAARCATTCWGSMALVVAAGHALPIMVPVFLLQVHERVTEEPRLPTSTAALATLGAVALLA